MLGDFMDIGKRIRAYREERRLTQKQLGDLCGMADSAIRRYESGRGNPTIKTLQRISAALGIEWTDLIPEDMTGAAIAADLINRINNTKGPWVRVLPPLTPQERIEKALSCLNDAGQQEAIERIEELTEIPKYQRKPEEGDDNAVDTQKDD